MRSLTLTLLLGLLAISAPAQKPNAKSARPKPSPTPTKKLNEQAEWDKANALTTATERIAAFKRFIKNFPKSTRLTEATSLLVSAEYGSANEKLVAGAIDDAADLYTAAVNDAPKPIPETIWSDQLSKIAPNLYFRGARGEALDIAKLLEAKADASVPQLLDIASFYLSIESGVEAKRVAEAAIKFDGNSSAAYQTLGLADRMEFDLEGSAAAFAKALELEPDSLTARRGLAEMQRSLGRADEAVALYRQILAKDEANVPARTGLILSLFDAGSRADAETEMARSLEENPGNVILLAGAAYWYAAHSEGDKAVEYAQKAIATDPRFVWSHIALARGFLAQGRPVEAEKTLLVARRYGIFPTIEYELASSRLAAGLYREAAEELAKSFTVADGLVKTKLGRRVPRESKYVTELVGYERRASIFAPTAADNPESASQLRALLELKQALDAPNPDAEVVSRLADEFTRGDDKMKVHRQLFAANQLLEKKIALPKVLEIVKAAPQSLDAGLEVSDVATAVLASELYEPRKVAAARDDYVTVPAVPRSTLSSVLRGRIEEITGWAHYQMNDPTQATVHLRRAVSVLPADSAYWTSSLWRLGTALTVNGNDAEGLDAYIRSYKGSAPDSVRYNAIATVYKRVKGSTEGLEAQIGPDPSVPIASELVAQKTEPTTDIPTVIPTPASTPEAAAVVPINTPTASPTPEQTTPSPTPTAEEAKNTPTPEASPMPTLEEIKPTPESPPISTREEAKPTPTPTVAATPPNIIDAPPIVPVARPTAIPEAPSPVPSPTVEIATPSPTPTSTPDVTPTPTATLTVSPTPERESAVARTKLESNELFPPVIITIPVPETTKPSPRTEPSPTPAEEKAIDEAKPVQTPVASPTPEAKVEEVPTPTPTPTPEITPTQPPSDARPRVVERPTYVKPCRLTVSEEAVTLQTGGGDLAVIVGRDDDNELDGLTATSTSPENVSVRRQVIEGMRTRALFVLHPVGTKSGVFQVLFEMPCGRREIVVRVK
jgi:tetratricopeptide (TPR) repeat protein